MFQPRVIATIALSVTFSGCAFSPVEKPNQAKHVPLDKVWIVTSKDAPNVLDATKVAFESAGYEVGSVTPELGELKTKAKEVPIPEVCDCGTWNGNVVKGGAKSVLIANFKPQPNNEGSLTVSHVCATTFMGRNLYGAVTTQEAYTCASRGLTETDVAHRLESIFKARGIGTR